MTPLDKIKKGILNNDMEEVIDGYESLTGERVTRKEAKEIKSEKVPEQVREVPEEKVNKYEDFTAPVRRESSEKSKYTKKEKIKVGKNTFVDTGEDHKTKADSTPDYVPTPRNRRPVEKVKVRCHVCGAEDEVNEGTVYGAFYRCGRCVGG
jgi:hypothetical protein